MGDERNHDGRFTPEHTDGEILAAVRAHEPAATSEVADEVDMTRQGADRRLRRLRDAGRVNSKKIGASLVWFGAGGESTGEDAGAGGEGTTGPSPGASDSRAGERRESDAENNPMEDALADVDFPTTRTRDREECVAAVLAARDYIREHDGATKKEIVRAVMPEHPLGYDVEDAVAKLDAGERYRGAWWRKVVTPGLKALPDVEPPARGASTWHYVGEGSG